MKPLVATVAVLVALATGAPVQAQTPELDELRALAEQGHAEAQYIFGLSYDIGKNVRRTTPRRSGGIGSRPTRDTLERS